MIARSALYGIEDDPVEVSWRVLRGTLKSPPKIKTSSWKAESICIVDLKKGTCFAFGAYIFAIVKGSGLPCLSRHPIFEMSND